MPENQKYEFEKLKTLLNQLQRSEIDLKTHEIATDFARFCRSKNFKGTNKKCIAIDFINFIFAKRLNVNILSTDNDMKELETLYLEYLNISKAVV